MPLSFSYEQRWWFVHCCHDVIYIVAQRFFFSFSFLSFRPTENVNILATLVMPAISIVTFPFCVRARVCVCAKCENVSQGENPLWCFRLLKNIGFNLRFWWENAVFWRGRGRQYILHNPHGQRTQRTRTASEKKMAIASARRMVIHNNARMAAQFRSHEIDWDLLLCARRRTHHIIWCDAHLRMPLTCFSFGRDFYLSRAKDIFPQCDWTRRFSAFTKKSERHWHKRFRAEQKSWKQWNILIATGLALPFPPLFSFGPYHKTHVPRRRVKYLYSYL